MINDQAPQSETVIACDPSALTPEQMDYWVKEILPKLYKAVQELRELPDGYAFRLPSNSETLTLIAEDLNMERLCCPFVRYTVEIEPNHGPFWLRMTGVKEFLRMSFEEGNLLDEQVARAAGINVSASQDLDSVETTLEVTNRLNARYAESR